MKKLTIICVAAGLILTSSNIALSNMTLIQPGPTDIKDTWVYEYEDYPHGDWGNLLANNVSVWDQRILIEFTDLSALSSAATINSAKLGLYRYDWKDGLSVTLDAYQITSSWAESVTFSTQPSYNSTVESSVTISGTDVGWYEWDVTNLVQQWVDGSIPNYGVAIFDHGSGLRQNFVSSDNVGATNPAWAIPPDNPLLRPYLKVDLTPIIPAPGAILLGSIGISLVGWLRRRRTL